MITAWLLGVALPIGSFPAHLRGTDPRFGATCAAVDTIFTAVTEINVDVSFAELYLQEPRVSRPRYRVEPLRIRLAESDQAINAATSLLGRVRDTLT
ncbi:MAG: hypothetical protein ABR975_09800, partial [Vulcanimicrobiaceae bacterium]